ncbi:MAG: type III-B CRISPR-associated protein Cas10/Cmr2 [Ignavibacteriales bacterium]|nr:type III-B CRISPR-associated protein Cas10/Cmr2 [Ignavibacteriales bacterium]
MNYTALTIGPIHKTLHSVKSTKAIWAASYMFSYLMKEIIKRIKQANGSIEFILPYSNEVEIDGKTKNPLTDMFQTGLFPDRLIIKENMDPQNTINKVIKDFSTGSGVPEDYLRNHINLYHLNVELNDTGNAIIKINELLDSLELQQRVLEKPNDSSLIDFLEKKKPYNFLIQNEFEARPFPSTIEISTAEFGEKYKDNCAYKNAIKKLKEGDDENQIEFIKDIKSIVGDSIRNYQKYIAVVQADGDNIGSFIKYFYKQDNKDELIKRFSKNLLSFAIEAVERIKYYKGTPIYAGGDDLLFFAPVAHTQYNSDNKTVSIKKNILTLIEQLDDKFDEYFKKDVKFGKLMNDQKAIKLFEENGKKIKKPTMSYGVSISYYKYPLNQALEEGVNQLFNKAKKGKKNAVSFTILKHSGQFFGATFNKDDASYTTFNELIKEDLAGDNFINSIIYKIEPQKEVFKAIGERANDKRNEMFDNFFWNNFNESIHKDKNDKSKLMPFLESTKKLFKEVYKENELSLSKVGANKQNDLNILKIYSALRFIEFIHNKEDRDE